MSIYKIKDYLALFIIVVIDIGHTVLGALDKVELGIAGFRRPSAHIMISH